MRVIRYAPSHTCVTSSRFHHHLEIALIPEATQQNKGWFGEREKQSRSKTEDDDERQKWKWMELRCFECAQSAPTFCPPFLGQLLARVPEATFCFDNPLFFVPQTSKHFNQTIIYFLKIFWKFTVIWRFNLVLGWKQSVWFLSLLTKK